MARSKQLGGVALTVIILGVVSFLTDLSSEMILPLLPLFYISLGADMAVVGLIEGIAESTASIMKVISGWFSDRTRKRKTLVFSGYSMSAASKPFFALATTWQHVLVVRFTERIGKGIRDPPRDAMIADSSKMGVRGRAFGYHRALDTGGAILGPLAAAILFPLLGFRNIFLTATIPAAIAVLLILTSVKEIRAKGQTKPRQLSRLSLKRFSSEFKVFIFVGMLFTLGNFSYAFMLLRANGLGISSALVPLVYLLFNVVYAVLTIPAGILSDLLGRRGLISLGYAIFGAMCFGFAFATHSIHAVVLFAVYGMSMAITDTLQRTYVSDLVPSELRGTAFGIFHTVVGVATLPASLIAGFLWHYYGATATFIYGSALTFLAALVLIFGLRK